MSHASQSYDFTNPVAAYDELARDLGALLSGERDLIANAANTAALIYDALPASTGPGSTYIRVASWCWGPSGQPACVRIAIGKGVCGTAAARRETVVVEDARVSRTHRLRLRFEFRSGDPAGTHGELLGVLDLDSPNLARSAARARVGAAAKSSSTRWADATARRRPEVRPF
jgi:GAF domain-containing protein